MVSDNRPRIEFRSCPDLGVLGDAMPLMRQQITVETCESRQDRGYHKCHRCVHQRLGVRREQSEAISRRMESILRAH
jgi:hypothetical protein